MRCMRMSLVAGVIGVELSLASCAYGQDESSAFLIEPGGEPPAGAQVIGGRRPQSPLDWPASFKLKYGGGLCTATVIGPRTIITAAHCVPDNGVGELTTAAGRVSVVCHHHPRYAGRRSYDVALCSAASVIELPSVQGGDPSRYERLDLSGPPIPKTAAVVIQGYGCLLAGGHVGEFYIGDANVSQTAGALPYFVTKGAAVCSGDSGGGVFPSVAGEHRAIVGVNARGDLAQTSYITALSDPKVRNFIRDSADQFDICGVNRQSDDCHE